jgi:ATP-dependent Clp protease ATP-binding subunit ClpC
MIDPIFNSLGDMYDDEEEDNFGKSSRDKKFAGSSKSTTKKTPVLDNFGRDLTDLAEKNLLDPVIGRKSEIERVTQILGRRKKNNPVLIGEAGTGKTAIVEGLALQIASGEVPLSLQGKRVYTLDLTSLVAGTKYRGQFEERLKALIDELTANPQIIIFLDEIHTLVGAGNSSGALDAANILKPALARGEIQCIGATTYDEYRKNIESDHALDRRFQKVTVEPTSVQDTIMILKNIRKKYEDHHSVAYSDAILEECVLLSERYITDRYLPDKAIDIMDEVGSRIHIKKASYPDEIKEMEERMKKFRDMKADAVSRQLYEKAAQYRDDEKKAQSEIDEKKKKWENETRKNKVEVTESHVLDVVSLMTGIPITKLSDEENERLLVMGDYLKDKVIGQDHAIDKVVTTIQRNRIGLGKKNKPIGSFIFAGSTGVGKTELTKAISEYLFHSEDSLIRIDMSEYMEKFNVSKLIGSPPGYVGHENGGILTEKVKKKPYSVILLDEIEKAHPDIYHILLQVLDEGHLTDSLGRKINFKNTLIIMTSNIGMREAAETTSIGFNNSPAKEEEAKRAIIEKSLKKTFTPEFLNRLDEVVYFNRLTKEHMMVILDLHVFDLNKRLAELGYKMTISDDVKSLVIENGSDDRFGARILQRTLQKMVEDKISEIILRERPAKGKIFKLDLKKGTTDQIEVLVRSK